MKFWEEFQSPDWWHRVEDSQMSAHVSVFEADKLLVFLSDDKK